ncbi:MAG TPA: hypothetical protein VGQ62_11115 [Chloroflexota bacterium]|nr:hypothetical protein [Chloroflexota bacterium]
MPRWLAVGLGCLTALGMQALFGVLLGATAGTWSQVLNYVALFVALVLGGFVCGHFVNRQPIAILYGAFVAIVYILLTATVQATRDAIVAHELGFNALPPIDLVQLTLTDVVAMTAASFGAWLAGRSGTS